MKKRNGNKMVLGALQKNKIKTIKYKTQMKANKNNYYKKNLEEK